MTAPAIMVQGTASSVGKSLLVTALCRIFRQDGLRVAPFKSQNMANNSFVTPRGGEIGRAQAVQAEAAGVVPAVDMNPILLKPEGDARSQVVVLGKPIGSMSAREYHARKPELKGVIAESLARLRASHDLVVIEGAGSPAEINLRERDIVNMHVARVAGAPVILAGDIDRGGVFAAFVGTLELLEPEDRARVAAFVVNRFRGDRALLQPGLDFLETRTGVPVLGVVPFVPRLRIADEDTVSLDDRARRPRPPREALDVVVARLPRISNYDDLEPLEHEPGVSVRFVERPEEARGADLVVLPGSKSTASDLAWLRSSGLAEVVLERARRGEPVLGLCGGCQMLGESIDDPLGVESSPGSSPGLGLLPFRTVFGEGKLTAQVFARTLGPSLLTMSNPDCEIRLTGYEIHMGRLEKTGETRAPFRIVERNGEPVACEDGAASEDGSVVGTMIHGILENDAIRASLLANLRERRGLAAPQGAAAIPGKQAEYDRLAAIVRESLDMAMLRRLAGVAAPLEAGRA